MSLAAPKRERENKFRLVLDQENVTLSYACKLFLCLHRFWSKIECKSEAKWSADQDTMRVPGIVAWEANATAASQKHCFFLVPWNLRDFSSGFFHHFKSFTCRYLSIANLILHTPVLSWPKLVCVVFPANLQLHGLLLWPYIHVATCRLYS